MGYNLNGEGGLGALGSSFSKSDAGVIVPPTGMVICAIQFVGDKATLDSLKPETASIGKSHECISTQFAAHNKTSGNATTEEGEGGQAVTADTTEFPMGMTIFGRWASCSLSTDVQPSSGGMICYFSY